MLKKILLLLVVILIGIQFIRPKKNISTIVSANDILTHYTVPADVLTILKRSCYDCHSNNTVYPWYNNIQPVAWWLADHVKVGKEELNFSEFDAYPPKRQLHKLHALSEQVKDGRMPMDSYLWIHKEARLSATQKDQVLQWADSLLQLVAAKNNLPVETDEE
jgi:hypothetical protein